MPASSRGSILGVLMHLAGAARTSAMGVAGIGVHLWCVMGLKGMLPALLDWGAACLLITAVPLALCSRNAISGSTSIGNAPSAPFRGPCGWHGMPDGPHLIAAATFVGLVGLAPFHVAPLLVWAASLWYPHARGSTSSSIQPGGPCACIRWRAGLVDAVHGQPLGADRHLTAVACSFIALKLLDRVVGWAWCSISLGHLSWVRAHVHSLGSCLRSCPPFR